MNFKQFHKQVRSAIVGSDVNRQTYFHDHTIVETVDGKVFIDQSPSDYGSLEEAKEHVRQQLIQEDIQREIQKELYEEMSNNKVADIIRTHHSDVKVTDTLIESYVELASSKIFTTDPVAQDIRNFNKIDRLIEGKLDYKLNDGSVVMIDEGTQTMINNIFGHHKEVIDYMRESKENFLSVVNQLEE